MADDKILRDAQYRKGLGIAWFNATNSAIELVKVEHLMGAFKKLKGKKSITIDSRLNFWRGKFLEDHKTYYAEVIAQVGGAYNQKETIDRINATTTLEELKNVWFSISEDERHDKDIKKLVSDLKKKYEEA